jgi:hypothetical protein
MTLVSFTHALLQLSFPIPLVAKQIMPRPVLLPPLPFRIEGRLSDALSTCCKGPFLSVDVLG